MARILDRLPEKEYEVERIRILDFYVLFPYLLNKISFPRKAVSYRKIFSSLENKYNKVDDPKRIFIRLGAYQLASINALASYGLIDKDRLAHNKILKSSAPIPLKLKEAINRADESFPQVLNFLSEHLSEINLSGKGGLKFRTDLFDHQYDASI